MKLYQSTDSVTLADAADYDGAVMLDLLNDDISAVKTSCGKLHLALAPYQSVIVVFDSEPAGVPGKKEWTAAGAADLTFKIETAPYTDMTDYTVFAENVRADALPNITDIRCNPEFSGRIRYTCTFDRADVTDDADGIDLGTVGQTSHLYLNGQDLGVRVCPPYRYDLTGALRSGANELVIEVSNTLAGAIRDNFSHYMTIPASGLTGTLTWLK